MAVLGPGGVGGLLAALLARGGAEVTCLASAETAAVLATGGLRVDSRQFGAFAVTVRAAEELGAPVDVCFVCVKATQLEPALERVPADVLGAALVVPLLNGVEHVAALRRRYPGAGVVAATVRVESSRTGAGVIRHDSPFVSVELTAAGELAERVRRLAEQLEQVGVGVALHEGEDAVMWSKLNFLVPMALLTTHAQASAGEVRQDRREDLLALIGEVAALARAEGAAADERGVLAFFDSVPADMRSSMQRDADAGRPMELDAIAGVVIRLAGHHGTPVPVTARYVEELRARYPAQT